MIRRLRALSTPNQGAPLLGGVVSAERGLSIVFPVVVSACLSSASSSLESQAPLVPTRSSLSHRHQPWIPSELGVPVSTPSRAGSGHLCRRHCRIRLISSSLARLCHHWGHILQFPSTPTIDPVEFIVVGPRFVVPELSSLDPVPPFAAGISPHTGRPQSCALFSSTFFFFEQHMLPPSSPPQSALSIGERRLPEREIID